MFSYFNVANPKLQCLNHYLGLWLWLSMVLHSPLGINYIMLKYLNILNAKKKRVTKQCRWYTCVPSMEIPRSIMCLTVYLINKQHYEEQALLL